MKKLIKWVLILLGVFLLILIITPFLFKGKIITAIKTEANKNINAKLDFGDFSISLLRSFPNLSVNMEKLSIINYAPFNGDTLIYAGDLGLTIDIMSVISGDQIRIRKVFVNDPVMYFLVNKAGKANWDIAKSDGKEESASDPSTFKATLQKYSITNGLIVYDDQTMPFKLRLEGFDHSGTGDFTQDLFVLSTKTTVKKADVIYGGVNYLSNGTAAIDADLDMDMKNSKYTFKENSIKVNELVLGLDGWLAMPDTNIDMDLKFNAAKSDFKNFLSVVPAVYSANFSDLKTSGKMAFNGFVKGRYNGKSMPGFGIDLNIDNGMFKYPSLPSAVENVFVDLKINNPDGDPDHTVVNLSRMHVEMNKAPFDAKLLLKTPVSDPDIDAFMKGKIDLSGIQKLVPLEKGTTLTGILIADVTAKGRMSSIEQKRYEQFAASGNMGLTGMRYASAETKQPLFINSMQLSFNPQRVALTTLSAKMGKSDFNATGSLDNFLAYAIKDETLKGVINFSSALIDLNEFMGGETASAATKDTTQLSVLEVPANIDFTLNAAVTQLLYQNLSINNVKGQLVVRNQAIRMQDLFMQMLNGSVNINGGYSSADIKKPVFDLALNIKDFDIQKTVSSFATVEKLAPIAKNCFGKFGADMTVKGDLDGQMSPLLPSLNGAGKLTTSTITINNFPVFNKIAETLKMESWKKLDVPPVNPSFKFMNGRVYVDPFEMKTNGIKSTVAGSNGFDQTIDYTMATEIPRSSFGGAANGILNNLVSSANSKGANFSVGDVIPVNIKIGGTVTNPKIGTDLNNSGAKVMDDLKAKAKEEFNKKKEEAEARAREEADKLKKQANEKIDDQKQKAAAEADRIKKDAEAKAKAKSDSLKKAAEKKAGDEIKKLNPFKK